MKTQGKVKIFLEVSDSIVATNSLKKGAKKLEHKCAKLTVPKAIPTIIIISVSVGVRLTLSVKLILYLSKFLLRWYRL